ncbi:MAG: CAP domain-containing protein [Actinomycetota bacterium]
MRRVKITGLVVAMMLGCVPGIASAANPSPPFISKAADWLTSVNYYRAMAGLPGVSEDPNMTQGATNHSCYMLYNGITHDEVPGLPGYTASGDVAGNNSNVAVSSTTSTTNRSFVELWMTGPFHAIGILRPNLQTAGYGQCENSSTPQWHSGATLNVLQGLGSRQPLTAPILFPGNGTVTSLDRFIAESPSPLQFCGWTGSAGLPVVAMMPETFSGNPTATMSGPAGPVEVCVLSKYNTSSTAQAILEFDDAVVVVPRTILSAGTYTVSLSTSARNVTWSFSVDPAAADNTGPPPSASPSAVPSGWTAITPDRFVDTRQNIGASRLLAKTIKRIKLAGRLGLPTDAVGIAANFTVVNPDGPGHLIVWNCSSPMPDVSTLNFDRGEVVANFASTPLEAGGSICVYSLVGVELVIDINGYYSATSTGSFIPMTPLRVADSREGLGIVSRMRANTTVELPMPNVPNGATGVSLNVTSVNALQEGFITVFPCGTLPITSTVNPVPGRIRPNTSLTPLSQRGSICLYTLSEVDVVVDLLGYVVQGGSMRFTPSAPFRWLDTRLQYRPEMDGGTGGNLLKSGQVVTLQIAGQRNVPASAKAVSINITAVGGTTYGHLTVYPCGQRPPTSNVNHAPGAAVANGALVSLSSSGQLCLYTLVPVAAIIDVNGWWG